MIQTIDTKKVQDRIDHLKAGQEIIYSKFDEGRIDQLEWVLSICKPIEAKDDDVDFISDCKKVRDSFCLSVAGNNFTGVLFRLNSENLLIMYDQMMCRLQGASNCVG